MDIIYSKHSKERMKQRGFEEWEVEEVIRSPSQTKKQDMKVEAIGVVRNRRIKIIYILNQNLNEGYRVKTYIKIITAI